MMSAPHVGHRYSIDTIIPPVAANTEWVDAGAVVIGVEHRSVNSEIVNENLRKHGLAPTTDGPIPEDGGVSLHVCDPADRREYLRFDMFDDAPHYHYLCFGEYQLNVAYDAVACGAMRSWALDCLRERLPTMLAVCGADRAASGIDRATIEAALPRVIELIERSTPRREPADPR